MASNVNEERFQCSKCDHFLDLESKTLPCLHSLCCTCVEGYIEVVTLDNGKCPLCHEPVVTRDQLRLAPFLVKSLKRRHMVSSEWRCDWCFEDDGTESAAQIWCQDCEKLLCNICNRGHNRVYSRHGIKDLVGLSRDEAIRVITTDECRLHRKSKNAFCERCNVCVCDACYEDHMTASPQCPLQPLSVREEATKGKMRGPTLEQELREFEIRTRSMNARTSRSIDQLSTDYHSKCLKLWQDFDAFVEEVRCKLSELCDNMKQEMSEQARKWRLSLKERDDLLKKVKIWRHNLRCLLRDDAEDGDVVCGLRLVEAELSSRLRQSFIPTETVHWAMIFPKWCQDSLESLKKEMTHLTIETSAYFELESECRLPGSNLDVLSILARNEDNHVLVCDWSGESIKKFSASGVLVSQCRLTDGLWGFHPSDICCLSEDILIVCCPWGLGVKGGRLFFLTQKKCPPFLEKQKIIDTKEKEFYSLCQIDKTIFACDFHFKEIVCFNENGNEIKTIHIGGLPGWNSYSRPLFRSDPMTGNLWGTKEEISEIFVFTQNGEILQTIKIEEKIGDFRANSLGYFYFSNREGIFSDLSKKELHKFPKKSENLPRIFVCPPKLFVCFKNYGENLLKVFKID